VGANRMTTVLGMCFKEVVFLAASAGLVLCTTAVKMFEDGCPDTLRGYCGLPIPFTLCEQRFAWHQWHWTFWVDVAIGYFVVLGLRHYLRTRYTQKAL
jgi:hypothetical protein